MTNGLIKRRYNFEPFTIGNLYQTNCTRHSYYPLGPLFVKLHVHQPCLKALGTNTPFLSRVSTLGLKPSGRYSRQNGVSALRAFKTGQVHLVTPRKCGPRDSTRGGYKWTFWCIHPRHIGINGQLLGGVYIWQADYAYNESIEIACNKHQIKQLSIY